MPSVPYIVSGTITDENDTAVEGVLVTCQNTSNGTYAVGKTDSLGHYVIDLANASYTVGDTIIFYVRDTYVGETTFTISGESKTQDLSVTRITSATIRDKSWLAVYNLLQSGTYAISTDNIKGAMNSKLVTTVGYPIVIVSPPKVTNEKILLNRDGVKERSVSFNIMIYNTSQETAKTLADEVQDSMDRGWRVLAASGLKTMQFAEDDYDYFNEGENSTIHIYNIPVRFKYVTT